MDFYFDIGVAVLLRVLKDRRQITKYRPALFKLFRALADAFSEDAEVRAYANRTFNTPK